MRRPHSSRDLLGAWLYHRWDYNFPVVPSFTNGLKMISLFAPSATEGNLWATFKVVVRSRKNRVLPPTPHNMIWQEIPLQLFSLSGDERDKHKWVILFAVSADSHKELTVRQIIQHFGLFASDAALENKISVFFAQRAALALSHVSHLQGPTDPTSLALNLRATQTSSPDCDSPHTLCLKIGSGG